jgi:hypothetical protein
MRTLAEQVARITDKLGPHLLNKYFEQANRLCSPIAHTIIEYRWNGIVLLENGRYIFRALIDTNLTNWRLVWNVDVTSQFIK